MDLQNCTLKEIHAWAWKVASWRGGRKTSKSDLRCLQKVKLKIKLDGHTVVKVILLTVIAIITTTLKFYQHCFKKTFKYLYREQTLEILSLNWQSWNSFNWKRAILNFEKSVITRACRFVVFLSLNIGPLSKS